MLLTLILVKILIFSSRPSAQVLFGTIFFVNHDIGVYFETC